MHGAEVKNKIDTLLDAAYKKFIVRDFNSAIRDLKAAEVLDRENPEILYNLGINYCRMGLYKTAIKYFQQLLNLNFSFIDSLVVKKIFAYALIQNHQYTESLGALDDVLKLVPADVAAMNMKGYCYEMLERDQDALTLYRHIIEIDRENNNANNSISYIISRTGGDLKESLHYANKAYKSDNHNPAYLDTLGYVYLKMNIIDMAEKILGEAIKTAPLSQDIIHHLEELEILKTGKKNSR